MYPGTWATKAPQRPAIIVAETGECTSYAELDARSNQIAHYFRSIGLRRGDHIAMVLDNHPRFLEAAWAAQRSGLYWTPVNWHLTAAEMAYVISDSQAKLVITSNRFADEVSVLLSEVAAGATMLNADPAPLDSPGDCIPNLLRIFPDGPIDDEAEGVDMLYSSGTTGRPKGASRPLPRTRPADAKQEVTGLMTLAGLGPESIYLSPGAPLYHAAPLRWCMATHRLGGSVVVMDRFEPLAALANIERYRVTHSQWVPTMFVRLLRLSETERMRFDLRSHEVALHAAAPCPPDVKRQMIEWWGPIVEEYWGSSEGGGISYITTNEWLSHPGSVGRLIQGTPHILDESGVEMPPGTPGVIYVEGGVPIRYHNDPKKTAAAHNDRGWSTVGDMGYLDEDGYLHLTDRRDHMIISGGVNIYPQEIEDVLIGHPAVADVAVIGVPNPEYGEEVKAIVQLRDESATAPELASELIGFCRQNLAAFKCPRSVDFVSELPRTPAGKLYKRRLRDLYAGAADAGVEEQ